MASSRTTGLDNRIPPPLVAMLIGIIMAAASRLLPAVPLSPLLQFGAAAIAFLVAGIFGFRAFAAFARAKTTIDPVHIDRATMLVTTGVYAFSRNPMYLALASLLVTLALLLSSPWLLLGPLVFSAFITRFQILPEERAMAGKFGEAYDAYRRRVRRWL